MAALHLCIMKTLGFTPSNPADFEPDKVICIIGDAHLIRFGIADIQDGFYKTHGFIGHADIISKSVTGAYVPNSSVILQRHLIEGKLGT